MSVRLTFTARDAAHARAIIDAVERLDVPAAAGEILVTPKDEPPTGHTYRELCDARRAGLLDATMTPKGLVLTEAALVAYRKLRDARRARKDRDTKPDNVTDLTARRIATLEKSGLRRRRPRAG